MCCSPTDEVQAFLVVHRTDLHAQAGRCRCSVWRKNINGFGCGAFRRSYQAGAPLQTLVYKLVQKQRFSYCLPAHYRLHACCVYLQLSYTCSCHLLSKVWHTAAACCRSCRLTGPCWQASPRSMLLASTAAGPAARLGGVWLWKTAAIAGGYDFGACSALTLVILLLPLLAEQHTCGVC
jgi:hypothetical protein